MIFINVRHKVGDLISGIKNWGMVLIRRKPTVSNLGRPDCVKSVHF